MHIDVDETGKGSVLGPMVVAAIRGDPDALPDGIADSKRLASGRREELTTELRERNDIPIGIAFIESGAIGDSETDVNLPTVRAQVEATAEVAVDTGKLVYDVDDMSESRFGCHVHRDLAEAGVSVTIRAQHRADDGHAIVSMVSIVAKVERDRRVEAVADKYSEVGGDYPSDGVTRKSLREYVRDYGILPDYARKSWSTCVDLMAVHEQSSLGDFWNVGESVAENVEGR